jgi:hypothetical protein
MPRDVHAHKPNIGEKLLRACRPREVERNRPVVGFDRDGEVKKPAPLALVVYGACDLGEHAAFGCKPKTQAVRRESEGETDARSSIVGDEVITARLDE